MTVEVAQAAVEMAIGCPSRRPYLLAAGRSSSAWSVASTGGDWVVRIPIPDSGRSVSYRSEATIGDLLHAAGHPVASSVVVEVDGIECSVGRLLEGAPVVYGAEFSPDFADSLGRLLQDLHSLPADGFGPLSNDGVGLQGRSDSIRSGITDRWCHAQMWPFDGTSLSGHPVVQVAPETVGLAEAISADILAAGQERLAVLHSDLHQEHLLLDGDGGLAGVLDFGASFIGSVAWDFAVLHWYYGAGNVTRVAESYPDGAYWSDLARFLAVAVGLYKVAKTPLHPALPGRLQRVVDAVA